MIVLDTSALYAYFRANDPDHEKVAAVFAGGESCAISPFVIAELDYLVAERAGVAAELAVLNELSSGRYELPSVAAEDLITCLRVIERYSDQSVGVTDASIVVLADRLQTNRVLSLDKRHFEVLRTIDGEPFEVLP